MPPPPKSAQNSPVEVEFLSKEHKHLPKKIYAEADPLEEKLAALKNRVQKLSDKNRRVKKESQAYLSGKNTVNRKTHKLARKHKKKLNQKLTKPLKKSPTTSKRNYQPLRLPKTQSTRSSYIPGVAFSHSTALNTDQGIYFTFYQRTKNKIRPQWIRQIRSFIQKTPSSQLLKMNKANYTTNLRFILNQKGYLKKVAILNSSGNKQVDQLAVNSIKQGAPMLNPPSGMIQDDGLVYIYYRFYLQLNPRHTVGLKNSAYR